MYLNSCRKYYSKRQNTNICEKVIDSSLTFICKYTDETVLTGGPVIVTLDSLHNMFQTHMSKHNPTKPTPKYRRLNNFKNGLSIHLGNTLIFYRPKESSLKNELVFGNLRGIPEKSIAEAFHKNINSEQDLLTNAGSHLRHIILNVKTKKPSFNWPPRTSELQIECTNPYQMLLRNF
ncbi:unnamed protein product [Owenia fusiformis]|uniref:Uncharacterized protein n=1 Tax=Owenia fusiformis TaxID=6347 RepID=A0A8S4Q9A0_OWEFU|nr:unnamed protein product [Owenia fusiformis]